MTNFRRLLGILTFLCSSAAISAQSTIDIDLWSDGLPNTNGIDTTQPYDDSKQNFKPSIRVSLPPRNLANGMAVICCPGGAYSHLAIDHEGYDWAPFFNERGFAFITLKYRMPHAHPEVPQSDIAEAFRVVRSHAADWGLRPDHVGVMGSSAGGHLASTFATHADSTAAPAFQILFYPVITMAQDLTHHGSRINLLGPDATDEQVRLYSNELQVKPSTPRAIIMVSDDDGGVPPLNSVNYYAALNRHHVPASLHIYPKGGHGWGAHTTFAYHTQMQADLAAWLNELR